MRPTGRTSEHRHLEDGMITAVNLRRVAIVTTTDEVFSPPCPNGSTSRQQMRGTWHRRLQSGAPSSARDALSLSCQKINSPLSRLFFFLLC
ncbi:hypothetical protein PUN28_001415 [Cardiocondyla obscurior]|uniref:Uncharacterized protein n=1 Tax=Cardiocondyla obscurior TaxID=286306 RepID=A0AAW2H4U4_9HYME